MARIAFVIGGYPPEQRLIREQAALAFASPEVEVGIVSVSATPYIYNLTPAEVQLVAPAYIEAYREAERQGYDAIVPLGTLDLGVDGGRSVVDIPIIAPMEAMLHIACLLGDRFGILVYHNSQYPAGYRTVNLHNMRHKVVGWRSCGIELVDVAKNKQAQIDAAVAGARDLIEKEGADVILPMGITLCPVNISAAELSEKIGVPVVEGIGAPIRLAAMMVQLGLRHSRKFWPKSHSFAKS